jgi:hypothetical protein
MSRFENLAKELVSQIINEHGLNLEHSEDIEDKFNDTLEEVLYLASEYQYDEYASNIEEDYKNHKKQKSPYINFLEEMRPILENENPSMTNKQINTKLDKIWDSLSSQRKDKYKF